MQAPSQEKADQRQQNDEMIEKTVPVLFQDVMIVIGQHTQLKYLTIHQ